MDPSKLENPGAVFAQLAAALELDKAELEKKAKDNSSFMFVKRQITPEEAARVEALNLKGVGLAKEPRRFYPNNFLAAHLLGFAGVDSQGLEGLEMALDKYLRGDVDVRRVRRDALGRTFLDRVQEDSDQNKGHTVVLTLDRRVQHITEKALAKAVEESGAKGGMALVVRPRTGEVLASAVFPSFNPNVFGSYPVPRRRNRVLTDAFDPGSTFKVFVVSAALEEGVVSPLDVINCERGTYKIAGHTIHDTSPHGFLTVNKVVKVSSNIGAAKIGEKLGSQTLYEYLTRFSFGRKTGIDVPGESSGLLRSAKNWHKLDLANVAFGQGVSVTGLQLTMAMSALANDGWLMQPYVVAEILDASGRVVVRNQPRPLREAVSSETAQKVRRMLRMVVTPGGTGQRAEPEGYPAAGKTGTAQKLDKATGTYSDKRFFSSFVGFVPFDDPQLASLVALDEPWPQTYGGVVAGPAFREIAEAVLPLYDVPSRLPPVIQGDGPAEKELKKKPVPDVLPVKNPVSSPNPAPVLDEVEAAAPVRGEKPVAPAKPRRDRDMDFLKSEMEGPST
jgi:cell division protein FtsI (penicillin-binding protein 3)